MGCRPSKEDAVDVAGAAGKGIGEGAAEKAAGDSSSSESDYGRLSSTSSSSSSTDRDSDSDGRRRRRRRRKRKRDQARRRAKTNKENGSKRKKSSKKDDNDNDDDDGNEENRNEPMDDSSDAERKRKRKKRHRRRHSTDTDDVDSDDSRYETDTSEEEKEKKKKKGGGPCGCCGDDTKKEPKKKRRRKHGSRRNKDDDDMVKDADADIRQELDTQGAKPQSSSKVTLPCLEEYQKMDESQLRDCLRERDQQLLAALADVDIAKSETEECRKDQQAKEQAHHAELQRKELEITKLKHRVEALQVSSASVGASSPSLLVPTNAGGGGSGGAKPPRSPTSARGGAGGSGGSPDFDSAIITVSTACQTDEAVQGKLGEQEEGGAPEQQDAAAATMAPAIAVTPVAEVSNSSRTSATAAGDSDELLHDLCDLLLTGHSPFKMKQRLLKYAVKAAKPPDAGALKLARQQLDLGSPMSSPSSPVSLPQVDSDGVAAQQHQQHETVLDLAGMEGFGDSIVFLVLYVIKRNPLISEIRLGRCGITDVGACELAVALEHVRPLYITSLSLAVNRVGNAGAVALAKAAQTLPVVRRNYEGGFTLDLEACSNVWLTSPERRQALRDELAKAHNLTIVVPPEPPL